MVIGSKNLRLGRPGSEGRYWFGNPILKTELWFQCFLMNQFLQLVGRFPESILLIKEQGDPPQLDLILQVIKDHIKMVVGYFTF